MMGKPVNEIVDKTGSEAQTPFSNAPKHSGPHHPMNDIVTHRPSRINFPNRWMILALVLLVAVTTSIVLNPTQDRHFREIDKIVDRRKISDGQIENFTITRGARYNSYFVFSTVTFGENGIMEEKRLLSYGFWGTVNTTDDIMTVIRRIDEFSKGLKKPE